MKFNSIKIKEGFSNRTINFNENVNLIYSEKNSKGKTTLIRFLLYALGYNIPNTKKIKFKNCEVEASIQTEKYGEVILTRNSLDYIVAKYNHVKTTYVLPSQLLELHGIIYGSNNKNILDNILGAYYVDQEKGWTLLNRGTVIGSLHFNIEELIRGLSDCDCSKLIKEETKLSKELGKYRQIFSVAQYRESVMRENSSLVVDEYSEEVNAILAQLLMEQKKARDELKRIDKVLNDNKQFKKFVAEMKLVVQTDNDEIITVRPENIVGLTDTIDYLIAKRKIAAMNLSEISKQIESLKKEEENEIVQLSFFEKENLIEIFDKKIASVPINVIAIKNEITRLEKALKIIRHEISLKTRENTKVIKSLYDNILKYAKELEVGDENSMNNSYIFTSNLKELTGAILHKTVFAFRLAYIIEIEKLLGIKLPIILDSPSGKEVDPENVQLMVDILKRDFSDNQIIIASIFKYQFDDIKLIEIKERLIENNDSMS